MFCLWHFVLTGHDVVQVDLVQVLAHQQTLTSFGRGVWRGLVEGLFVYG